VTLGAVSLRKITESGVPEQRPPKHNQQAWSDFRIKLRPTQAEMERYENYKKFCQEHYDYEGTDEQTWALVVKSIREY